MEYLKLMQKDQDKYIVEYSLSRKVDTRQHRVRRRDAFGPNSSTNVAKAGEHRIPCKEQSQHHNSINNKLTVLKK